MRVSRGATILVIGLLAACGKGPADVPAAADRSPTPDPTRSPIGSETPPAPRGTAATSVTNTPTSPSGGAPVLSGRVGGPDGSGVPGICVEIFWNDDESYQLVGEVRTSAAGRYSYDRALPILPYEGAYFNVRFRDCRADPAFAFEWYPDTPYQHRAKKFPIERGATADATLGPAGSIGGRVTDDTGAPIAGICVKAFDGTMLRDVDDGPFHTPLPAVLTDEDGRFTVDGLPAKDFTILFDPDSRGDITCGDGRYRGEWFDDVPRAVGSDWDGPPADATRIRPRPGRVVTGTNATLSFRLPA